MTDHGQEPSRGESYVDLSRDRIDAALAGLLAPGAPYALLDWPNYTNIGDSAIWMGTVAKLRDMAGAGPAFVTRSRDFPTHLTACLPEGPILLLGGGNFGSLYPPYQENRIAILERFKGRPIIQLPQSLSFDGDAGIEPTRRAIAGHGQVTLLVRDRESADLAKRVFDCEVRLCPDLAFCMGALQRPRPAAQAVQGLMRADIEAASPASVAARLAPLGTVEDWTVPEGFKAGSGLIYSASRRKAWIARRAMPHLSRLFTAKADALVRHGLGQLSRGRVVVTDRLHGHILATLLGIPHVVLDNSYGKIARYRAAWPGDDLATVWDGEGDIRDLIAGLGEAGV